MKFSRTKIIIIIAAALSMLLCFTSCKTNKTDAHETKSESVEQPPDAEKVADTQPVQAAEKPADDAPAANQGARNAPEDSPANPLPAYQYPGDDPIPKAISDYLTHEIAKNYPPADVCIPSFSIVGTNASNPDDTLVWGDFWIFNYKLENDTLLIESGGSHPGLMHLKKTDDGYTVTKMDVVADGADNLKSAKEIFADKYDDFHKINSNQDEREKIRLQFISDYVKANKLSITKVKDSDWDPVLLP
ncbi:MAG: hypothetical protein IJM59_07070 [Proteobacteria bacterium]|nr:hypothetical protein [Pseudomonadota bacterium]